MVYEINGMPSVLINGQPYVIWDETPEGVLDVCRPDGMKHYRARRLPNHPMYGENRARIDHTPERT